MKFLLVATILIIAVTVEGVRYCQRGTYYWCQSKSSAEKCMKTRYCQDNVWKNGVATLEKNVGWSTPIKRCEQMVQEMNRIRTYNLAEDSEALCSKVELCSNSLMNKSWSPKKTETDDFECELCNLLAKQALKKINGSFLQEAAKDMAMKASVYLGDFANDWPDLIDTFGDKIYSSIISAAGNKIKPALETVCGTLPSNIATGCNDFIDLGLDILGNKVNSSSGVCSSLKLCESSEPATQKNRAKNVFQDNLCEICQVTAIYSNTKYKPDLRSIQRNVCKRLPGSLGRNCTSLVNKFDQSWDILKQVIESGEICDILKVCKSSTRSLKLRTLKVTGFIEMEFSGLKRIFDFFWNNNISPLIDRIPSIFKDEMPDEPVNMCNMFQVYRFSKSLPFDNNAKRMNNAGICDRCKMAAIFFLPYMDKKMEIRSALKRVCMILPSSISGYCYNQINSNEFDRNWDIIKQEIESGGICDMLLECTSSTTRSLKKMPLGGILDMLFSFFKIIFDFRNYIPFQIKQEIGYAEVENDIL